MKARLFALGLLMLTAACGQAPAPVAETTAAVNACTDVGDEELDALVARSAAGGTELADVFRCLSEDQQRHVIEDAELAIDEAAVDLSSEEAAPLRARLMREVERAARVWWDTILEGPYSLEGDAEIRDVEELLLNGRRIALRLSFGAPAVMTESCETTNDESDEGWPEDCTRGTISQTLYFDEDLDPIEPLAGYADFDD
ncbi:MAG: hypothetical protein KIT84_22695 [Labilithrix sp.]|nr:hypothetical protein [Labilithrix sp.]MCW5813854.1 hypothetical protein [Labilithrix sp.]